MRYSIPVIIVLLIPLALAQSFPEELVTFTSYENNPVFTAGKGWETAIRERGWIMKEDGIYKLWYTGYAPADREDKRLGYATSEDGITFTRYPGNPIFSKRRVEDMMVIKQSGVYYMYAESTNDQAI